MNTQIFDATLSFMHISNLQTSIELFILPKGKNKITMNTNYYTNKIVYITFKHFLAMPYFDIYIY